MISDSDVCLLSNDEYSTDTEQENYIINRFIKRQKAFHLKENLSQYKDTIMKNELLLGENKKDIIIKKKRLNKPTKEIKYQKLINNLTVPLDIYQKCSEMKVQKSMLFDIVEYFYSNQMINKYIGLVGIRKLLVLQDEIILKKLIELNILIEIFSLLENSPFEFQYEALFCLNTIVINNNNSFVNNIIENIEIGRIINLLDSDIKEIKLKDIILTGNLAKASLKLRKDLLDKKLLDKFFAILSITNDIDLIKKITWSISNFFKSKKKPSFDICKKCVKTFARIIILYPDDYELLVNIYFIISSFVKNNKEIIKDLFDFEIILNIIKNLDTNIKFIQINCLKIIKNIIKNNINETQKLIDLGILEYLKKLIYSKYKQIRNETILIISKISVGSQKHKEILIEENFLPLLNQIIIIDSNDIKKKCFLILCNLAFVENQKYIKKILDQNILDIIYDYIKEEKNYLIKGLEAVVYILCFGQKYNYKNIMKEICNMRFLNTLEKLQLYPNKIINEKTLGFLEKFLPKKKFINNNYF